MQNDEKRPTSPTARSQSRPSFFNLPSSGRRWAVFAFLAFIALAVRLPRLGERPMHSDEAVNASITGDLLAGESFHYDPRDRHGPVLQLFGLPIARLCGAKSFSELSETQLRLTPVLAGSATVLLFGAGVEMFGFAACLIAALLFVVAPLPVYYSRDFIHETLFVGATLGLMLSGWRALSKHLVSAAAMAGLSAALMFACKETSAIHYFALAVALAAGWRLNPHEKLPPLKIVAVAFGVFITVGILLFTWFGRNWRGLVELSRALPHLAARAGGEGHEKPFGYYFHLLDPTFLFFLLAIIGAGAAVRDAVAGVRKTGALLVVYTLTVCLIYSAIPYKTPWLALNLWLPLALLCGLGINAIWSSRKGHAGRWVTVIIVGILLVILGKQTKALAFDQPADEKNPLAYAHTVDDILRLPRRLEQLTHEEKLVQPLIAVAAADPWPLPWYLRKFQRVGFWQPGQNPAQADFYITSPEEAEALQDRLKGWLPEIFGVRPEVVVILWRPKETSPLPQNLP